MYNGEYVIARWNPGEFEWEFHHAISSWVELKNADVYTFDGAIEVFGFIGTGDAIMAIEAAAKLPQ